MSDPTDTTSTTPISRPAPKATVAAAQLATAQGTPAASPAEAAVEVREDGRAPYEVTERAGPRVGGQLVGEDGIVWLWKAEAAAELLDGTIVPKGEKPHAMFASAPPAAEPAKD